MVKLSLPTAVAKLVHFLAQNILLIVPGLGSRFSCFCQQIQIQINMEIEDKQNPLMEVNQWVKGGQRIHFIRINQTVTRSKVTKCKAWFPLLWPQFSA